MTTMPFGKHQGEDIEDIPTQYLKWLVSNTDIRGYLLDAIEDELESRDKFGWDARNRSE